MSSEESESEISYTEQTQFKRQFNASLIYYILTKCDNYKIFIDNKYITETRFIRINTITKNDDRIFDIEDYENELEGSLSKRTIQLEEIQFKNLSKILKKEKDIHLKIKVTKMIFEINKFVDKKCHTIDVDKFINKYYHFEELNEMLTEMNFSKWKFQNPNKIEQLLQHEDKEQLTFHQQLGVVNRKINKAMMNYLLTVCNNYKIKCYQHYNKNMNQFDYIETIQKGKKIVFDSNDYTNQSEQINRSKRYYSWRNNQMKRMGELIEQEKGIRFEFYDFLKSFEITKLVYSENNLPIDLYKFVTKYENKINENKNENDYEEDEDSEYSEYSESVNDEYSEESSELSESDESMNEESFTSQSDDSEESEQSIQSEEYKEYKEIQKEEKKEWEFQNINQIYRILEYEKAETLTHQTQLNVIKQNNDELSQNSL